MGVSASLARNERRRMTRLLEWLLDRMPKRTIGNPPDRDPVRPASETERLQAKYPLLGINRPPSTPPPAIPYAPNATFANHVSLRQLLGTMPPDAHWYIDGRGFLHVRVPDAR
jgi:hypothetical protein